MSSFTGGSFANGGSSNVSNEFMVETPLAPPPPGRRMATAYRPESADATGPSEGQFSAERLPSDAASREASAPSTTRESLPFLINERLDRRRSYHYRLL